MSQARPGRGVFRLEGGDGADDAEQRALLERAGVDERVELERIELGEGVGAVHGKACEGGDCQREGSHDCGLDCSATTNKRRLGRTGRPRARLGASGGCEGGTAR